MKKSIILIFSGIFLAAIVSSCNKDDKNKNGGEKFSKLTVEQNKAVVEDAGIALVGTMDNMKALQTTDVLFNLTDMMSGSSGAKKAVFSKESKILSTLETFVAAAKGEKKLNDVFKAMVASKELSEDPQSIQEFWDANVGTYTWNPGLSDWDIVLGGTTFLFLFPSSDVATTNDATFTISDYTGVTISPPVDTSYTGDFPVAVNAELKVGTMSLITYVFAAEYNTDGIPKKVASDLTIENYKFEIDLTNDTKVVAANYKFLENTTVIMEMGATGEGLFTEANYDANTKTTTETYTNTYGYWNYVLNPSTGLYDQVWVEETYSWEETNTNTDFEEILNSAAAHFQLFELAIRGDVNVKGLVDQINIIDKNREDNIINDATADSLTAININKFMNLRLVNVTTNEIMAKAQAYVLKDLDYFGNEYTSVDLRLTFNDGSPIDVETYFDSGFNGFVDEMNNFITGVNSDFNTSIEPIIY
jgi:hypothetical protein